jgi:N-acyl-D-aspartate/D-glutamate deacylase
VSDYDLAIRAGTIVDGAGGRPFLGDVAVKDGVIVAVGEALGRAEYEIDAEGRIVTPGFVDVHTHYDGQAIWSERLNPSSSHGVTSVVMGNCGVGFAPCRAADHELLIKVMEGVEDIPGVVMAEGLPWSWETFPQYLDALEARRRDIDVAAYLPHSPLRVYAMGERGARREAATSSDLNRMRALAREAIEAGALGFASSRLNIHRTADGDQIPSFDADVAELRAIAAGMSDAGGGVLQMVLDAYRPWEDEFAILAEVVAASGRPATFTLAANNVGPRRWDAAVEAMEAANAAGAAITAQVLPRPIGLILGLELSINPFVLCPSFKAIARLPLAEKVVALRHPDRRAAILAESPDAGHPLAAIARDWAWMFPLDDPPDYAPPASRSIAALAGAAGRTPAEAAYDRLLEDNGTAMMFVALGNFHEARLDAVREFLIHPDCIVGLGDGGAHYGAICDASHPTFMLTYWVRDRDGPRLSLAEAVHMLARKPAAAVGLHDRGLIRPGYKADLNVIDLERLTLHAPHIAHDLPAGGRRLDQRASGYDATVVAGEIIRRFDQPTEALPGALVRGAQAAPARR